MHAVVARSIFRSRNVQNTPCSEHFWKLRCRKSARCCCAKHISKSKCIKHLSVGPLLEVAMSKKCTLCGAKHISKSKCTKHFSVGPLLEVEMLKSVRRCGTKHVSNSKCTKHTMFGPLLEVQMSKKCRPSFSFYSGLFVRSGGQYEAGFSFYRSGKGRCQWAIIL